MSTKLVTILFLIVISVSCTSSNKSTHVCSAPIEFSEHPIPVAGIEGLDLLIVVSTSNSTSENSTYLTTRLFTLINALVNPTYDWLYPSVDNVRVAVVSSDMGLQYGSNGDIPAAELQNGLSCIGLGKNGAFISYDAGTTIEIENSAIPCSSDANATAPQCPGGWVCENELCHASVNDSPYQICPPLSDAWIETQPDDQNVSMTFQTACLAAKGTSRCGVKQPLKAAVAALSSHPDFIRIFSALAVIVISDGDDCSIDDGNTFFALEEMADSTTSQEIDLSCGRHPDLLLEPSYFYNAFLSFKTGPFPQHRVAFIPITGAPEERDCQVATPGSAPRLEALAEMFQSTGQVHSVCSEDWSQAITPVSRVIQPCSVCYPCFHRPLEWNPITQKPECNLYVDYQDLQECPFDLEPGATPLERVKKDNRGKESQWLRCPLPKLSLPVDCADAATHLAGLNNPFGWYYCETQSEDFDVTCSDEMDNDGDEYIDCDDPDCQDCVVCNGSGRNCKKACRYVVELTINAKTQVFGHGASLRCQASITSENPNCQENTQATCNDGLDNDGNGLVDCSYDNEKRYLADPECCPMEKRDGFECVVKEQAFENCPGTSRSNPSDACKAMARHLECTLPEH